MRRALVVALALGLIAGSLTAPAEAGKKKKPKRTERTMDIAYGHPAVGGPTIGGGCLNAVNPEGCPTIALGATEGYVKVTIDDASGTDTAIGISQNSDPSDDFYESVGEFCGTTGDEAVAVQPGLEVVIFIWSSGDGVCPGAVGTSGTLSVTISNMP